MMTRTTYHKSSQLPNKPKRKKKPKGSGVDRKLQGVNDRKVKK